MLRNRCHTIQDSLKRQLPGGESWGSGWLTLKSINFYLLAASGLLVGTFLILLFNKFGPLTVFLRRVPHE